MFDGEYAAQFRESWRVEDDHIVVIEYTKGRPGFTWHIHAMLESMHTGVDVYRGSYECRNEYHFAEMLRHARAMTSAKLGALSERIVRIGGGSHDE